MGLFSKKSKKKGDDRFQIAFQWKMFDNREYFSVFVDDEDIADRLVAQYVGETDMLAFDPDTNRYFLLENAANAEDDVLYDAEAYQSASGALLLSYDNLENFYFVFNGEHLAEETESFWIEGDLCIWLSKAEDYFYIEAESGLLENKMFIPVLMNSPNGALWYKNEENFYWLFQDGINISEDTESSYLESDLLLCNSKTRTYYLFPGWENADPMVPYEAEILNFESPLLWAKVGDGKHYDFFDKGVKEEISDWKAVFYNDDVLVYIPDTNEHFLLSDFKNVDIGELYVPQKLPSTTPAVWARVGEKSFVLFVKGQNISAQVEPKMMDGNLLLLDNSTNTIYVCMQFYSQQIYDFQPAVLMDANEFR